MPSATTEFRRLLTTAQAAARLQISSATLRGWARDGRVSAVRHGRGYRFDEAALMSVETHEKCHSISVKVHRSGGRMSAYPAIRDFESQLTQLIETKRSASTTNFARSSGRSPIKLTATV